MQVDLDQYLQDEIGKLLGELDRRRTAANDRRLKKIITLIAKARRDLAKIA